MIAMQLRFERLGSGHLGAALNIVAQAYQETREALPYLPNDQDMFPRLEPRMATLFHEGYGLAALDGTRLVGFITGIPVRELWGRCQGIYSPLYGHGAVKEDRSRIYQRLYQQVADLWVQNRITSHAITLYAQDIQAIHTWFWLGFGHRCVDAIRRVQPLSISGVTVNVQKVEVHQIVELARLRRELHLHSGCSPMFMHREHKDPVIALTEWFQQENRHMWVAYRDGEAIGFMQIQAEGENFVADHPSVMNITGAYVLPDHRRTGAATLLLDTVQKWLMDHSYPLCGVDYESFNIDGARFWHRHFSPYTYSLTRRIDERIIEGYPEE